MQAVAIVAVIAITLGTVGALLMSRGAHRVSYGGQVNGPRYTVTTELNTKPGEKVYACRFDFLSLPAPVCGGVIVTNVDIAVIANTKTQSNGVIVTPTVRLVGTWDGYELRLTERPQPSSLSRSDYRLVSHPPPPTQTQPSEQVLLQIARERAYLQKRGILLLEFGEGTDQLPYVRLAVADAASVQYLYDRFGRMNIYGWLQPLDAPPSPLPTPTVVPPTESNLPTTVQLSGASGDVVWAHVYGPPCSTIGACPNGSTLFRSTDRGSHWEQRSVPYARGRIDFSFVNATEGWFSGLSQVSTCSGNPFQVGSVELWHTGNGAATWEQVPVVSWQEAHGTEYAQCKESLSFIDQAHGFLSAWDDNHPSTIYRTLDGGRTWEGKTLPDPPDFKRNPGGFTLRLGPVRKTGNALYVVASGKQQGSLPDRQYVYGSTDGGATWTWLTKVPSRYVVMVTESRWLQLLAPGQSMETTNAGQQWHAYASDFNSDTPVGGPQILFGDSKIGYAEGRGALQRTVDGGLHWSRITTPAVPAVKSPPDPKALIARGCSGPAFDTTPLALSPHYEIHPAPGWTDTHNIGPTESRMLQLIAPATYGDMPTQITFHVFSGSALIQYGPKVTARTIAAEWGTTQYGHSREAVVTTPADCSVASEAAAVYGYSDGSEAGYRFFLIHKGLLYAIWMSGTGGISDKAIQDALRMIGSIVWTS
jgi:photosystem II stability/assembly factor-like uncharacterized protein